MTATTSIATPQASTKAQGQFDPKTGQNSETTANNTTEACRQLLHTHGPLTLKEIMRFLQLPVHSRPQGDIVRSLLRKTVMRGQVLYDCGLYSLHPLYKPSMQANRKPKPRGPALVVYAAPPSPARAATTPGKLVASPYRPDIRTSVYTCPELRTAPPRGEASLAPYRLPSRGMRA